MKRHHSLPLPMLMLVTLLTAGLTSACDDDESTETDRSPSKSGSAGKKAPATDERGDEPADDSSEGDEAKPSTGRGGAGGSGAAGGGSGGGTTPAAGSGGSERAADSGGTGGSSDAAGAGGAGGEAGSSEPASEGGAGGAAGSPEPAGSGGAGGAGGSGGSPVPLPEQFVLATSVSTGDDTNTYIKTIDSLEPGMFDTRTAREFSGTTDMIVLDRWMFTSNDESAVVTRFRIQDDGSFRQEMQVSFANYGSAAPLYYNAFVSKTKAYMLTDSGEYVVWNPTTMEITGTIPLPEIADRKGIPLTPSLDRGMVVRGNRLFHAYAWTDYEEYITNPASIIAVIDTDNDELVKTLEAPCPDLDGGTLDDEGNLYYSAWTFAPPGALLVNGGPKTCVVKIPANSEAIDPNWKLTFADITEGHEGGVFRYIGNGKALISVFYEDHSPYEEGEIAAWVFGDNWRFMRFDLATRATELVEDIPWSVGGYYPTRIGDDTYLLVQQDESTTLYRLKPDNSAMPTIVAPGWAMRFFPL